MAAPRVSKVPIRRQYTDLDKWRVFNAYLSNGGYTKTAAKDCYISVSTVRSWIKAWDFDPENHLQARNPPQQPSTEELELIEDDDNLVVQYQSILQMSLNRLKEVIPKTNSADQLGRVVKDMADRIDRAKGIGSGELSTPERNSRLDEAAAAGAGMISELVRRTVDAAKERSDHIIEAEAITETREIESAAREEDGSIDDA